MILLLLWLVSVSIYSLLENNNFIRDLAAVVERMDSDLSNGLTPIHHLSNGGCK